MDFDHVIVAVDNLDEAAARFAADNGLVAVEGGRHDALGTANRIIGCGDSYIELLAVVDRERFGMTGLPWPASEGLLGWMLRTDEIDRTAARLGLPVTPLSRDAGGATLSWKLAGMSFIATEPCLPVFIDWSLDTPGHPARTSAVDNGAPVGFSWIEVSGDDERIARWCEGAAIDVRVVPGEPSVRAVAFRLDGGGEIELRYEP